MPLDAELELAGFNSKERAKFFNKIWHPYLPRKVSSMQWLILTGGLPVGAWRERLGLPSNCQICDTQERETLQHAFLDCREVNKAWTLFNNTRRLAGLTTNYTSWQEVSRGQMNVPTGPSVEEDLRWDTAAAFSINTETPWDILRAQLLWALWCQRVSHAFKDEQFHLGAPLWHAWRNTIYCAMEAYKELFRHKRNEEKRQEMITCFQSIWTTANIFGRLGGTGIKWHITPHQEFLPKELGALTVPPININRLSPSPDVEAEFTARTDFPDLVQAFLQGIGNNWRAPPQDNPNSRVNDTNTTGQTEAETHRVPTEDDEPVHHCPHEPVNIQEQPHIESVSPSIYPAPDTCNYVTQQQRQARTEEYLPGSEDQPLTTSRRLLTDCTQEIINQQRNNGGGGAHRTPASIQPKSRNKIKCDFGPKRQKASNDYSKSRHQHRTAQPDNGKAPPRSRNKLRCTFGPKRTFNQNKATELTSAQPSTEADRGTTPVGATSPPQHQTEVTSTGTSNRQGETSSSRSILEDTVDLTQGGISHNQQSLTLN